MKYQMDGNKLILIADEDDRNQLRELGEAIHQDVTMQDFLEPLTCNSELDWIRPEETRIDLTDAPMLGLRNEDGDPTHRWAWMDYQVKSLLEKLRDDGQAVLVGGEILLTIGEQIEPMTSDWEKLVASLIPQIDDDYRASDDPEDDTPGMCLTIGFKPAAIHKDASWSYQTGDNSYTGGAYGCPHWAVVSLYRDSVVSEVVDDIASQIHDLCAY